MFHEMEDLLARGKLISYTENRINEVLCLANMWGYYVSKHFSVQFIHLT